LLSVTTLVHATDDDECNAQHALDIKNSLMRLFDIDDDYVY